MSISLYGAGQTVLQVVYASTTTLFTNASTSYVDLGLSASITPQSTNSKILAYFVIQSNTGAAANGHGTKLLRNGSAIFTSSSDQTDTYRNGAAYRLRAPFIYLDTPASTSALTYSIQVANYNGNTMEFNASTSASQIVLLEISGS